MIECYHYYYYYYYYYFYYYYFYYYHHKYRYYYHCGILWQPCQTIQQFKLVILLVGLRSRSKGK